MNRSAKGTPTDGVRNTGIRGGRLQRTVKSLVAMSLLGIGLATLNVVSTRHDLSIATGPKSQAQREWFIDASERPDIAAFFKKLSHSDRLKMSRAIGRYDD